MSHSLSAADFDDLLSGSQLGVLSAANTFPGSLEGWIRDLLAAHGPVALLDDAEADTWLPPEATAVTIGLVGSLTAMLEIPLKGDEPRVAIQGLERLLGKPFSAIAALNAAGPNALFPVAAACQLNLPLLDCDGQGRILPLVDQTTFALGGLAPGPLVGVGPWGDLITIESPRGRVETLVRSAVTAAGGWLLCASYAAPARDLIAAGIPRAFTRCLQTGATLRGATTGLGERLARQLGGRLIGRGRVLEIEQHSQSRRLSRQPAQPVGILVEDASRKGARIRLEVRNEVVLATVDGSVVASTPDTICLLDPLRRRTVDLLDLTPGDAIDVLLLPADTRWHTPEGRRLAGPEAFGLPISAKEAVL